MTLRIPTFERNQVVSVGVAMTPLAGDFVLDTFTRSGPVTATAGETGATWAPAFGSPDELSMDGAALYYARSGGPFDANSIYPSGTPPSGSYGVKATFTFDPSVSSSIGILLFIRVDDPAAGNAVIELDWRASDGDLYLSSFDLSAYVDNDLGTIGPTAAGTHSIALEVSGSTATAYLDDAAVGTLDVSTVTGLPAIGTMVLKIRDTTYGFGPLANTASLQIDEFRAYPL